MGEQERALESKIDVIFERVDGLKDLINMRFKETSKDIDEVKKKQDYTNGDVSALKLWKYFLLGCWAVTSIMVIPLLKAYLETKNGVQTQVRQVMSEYYDIQQ